MFYFCFLKHFCYISIQQEAKNIMGGKVLDYEAKTIYMDGKNDGIALGMAKGVAQGISGA